MKTKRYEMDMCSGPLASKILVFALPLMLSSMLQLLFNAADVIGEVGETALAESKMEPHLHLEVLVDGVPQDPMNYIPKT